jgi:sigma-B regulation protein RsbU (phosphoserine phosphatase)
MFERAIGDWKKRLEFIVATMKEMSLQTDPQAMVKAYAGRMRELLPTDRMVALGRRGLQHPQYRITRSSLWKEEINPWKEPDKLPVFSGGLLARLIYDGAPAVIHELSAEDTDPAAEYLRGMSSLIATPFFEKGVAMNMVLLMRKEPRAFAVEDLPEWVWVTSLFGRATYTLVLAKELQKAYEAVDHEMKVIADIQRSLLPAELPKIPRLDLAAHYQTSRRAGGDYYDFFPLPDGKWGILIADVSGHGTPAAVMMAITQSIAHSHPGPPIPPDRMLRHVNQRLAARYSGNGTFVTAFYGIFDPKTLALSYACAGHNPPRIKRCEDGSIRSIDGAADLPLGISNDSNYEEETVGLRPGDQLIFYTDGITEAQNPAGEMFGVDRLDRVLHGCRAGADEIITALLKSVDEFTAGRPADDDRTILVGKVLCS